MYSQLCSDQPHRMHKAAKQGSRTLTWDTTTLQLHPEDLNPRCKLGQAQHNCCLSVIMPKVMLLARYWLLQLLGTVQEHKLDGQTL